MLQTQLMLTYRLDAVLMRPCTTIQARRTEWRRSIIPVLVPVHSQPASGYAVALALPDWCQDRYCLRVDRAMSCALCSEVTNRA